MVKIQPPRIGEQLARDSDVLRALAGLAADTDQQFLTKLVHQAVLAFLGGSLGLLSAMLAGQHERACIHRHDQPVSVLRPFRPVLRVLVAILVDRLN